MTADQRTRWLRCVEISVAALEEPADSAQVRAMAEVLYGSEIPDE
jgi:hypothetical protein